MTKNIERFLFSILGIAAGFVLFQVIFAGSPSEDDKAEQKFRENYNIYGLNIPDRIDFAGEDVPLHDFEVSERLDRELLINTYWQSQTVLFIKKANRYFPVIEKILKEEGVPDDFKYLPLVESGFMHVVSPAGAAGFWQILKSTGKEYGLEINDDVDERYHIEKATRAACAYFKKAYSEFGSWTLAAASYNMGMYGVKRELKEQKVRSYYDLRLNSETSRYVFRILAVKEILANKENYGFHVTNRQLYKPHSSYRVKVDSSVGNWADFSNQYRINYKLLKEFNPWIKGLSLRNSDKREYWISIPEEIKIDSVSNLREEILEDTVNTLLISKEIEKTKFQEDDFIYYKVRRGESLEDIAQNYQVKISELRLWNNLESNIIKRGQKIKILKQAIGNE